jgi:hypothetical protein
MMMIDARRGSAVWPKRADSGILMPVVSGLIVVGVALLAAAGVVVLEQLVPAARRQAHNDVLGFVYAVIGVAYAVILAMVIVAAWNSLDEARVNTYTETDALLQLDWYGHSLPQPQHSEVEDLVKNYTTTVIDTEWPLLARHQSSSQAWAVFTQLRELVSDQQPTAPAAVARYEQALDAAADLGNARRERIDQAGEGIPCMLWAALVLGGVITVGFAFAFGMRSRTAHVLVVFSLTLLMGALLLVTYQLNYPFSGAARISPDAFELALQRIQGIS